MPFDFKIDWNSLPQDRSWTEAFKDGAILGGPSEWGNSKWSNFIRCPRRYYLAHIKRIKSTMLRSPLEVGGLTHEAVGTYMINAKAGHPKARISAIHVLTKAAKVAPETAAEARRLFHVWLETRGLEGYRPAFKQILAVERLATYVDVGFKYSCRYDSIVKGVDGKTYIRELKTSAYMSDDVMEGYKFSQQIIGQAFLWKACKLEKKYGKLSGIVIDMIVKTKMPQLKEEIVVVPDWHIYRWKKHMIQQQKRLNECVKNNSWPLQMSNCVLYKERCEYFDYCRDKSMDGLVCKEKGEW